MSRRVLLGTVVTLILATLPASAFCQAATESVLLNGASSSSAVKAGSALNSALNGANKRLAGHIRQIPQASPGEVHHQAQRIEMKNGAGSTSHRGGMIASVQGGVTACAPSAVNSRPTGDKADKAKTEFATANCQSGSVKPAPLEKYKSVITLPK
jgi:hypothetical protein